MTVYMLDTNVFNLVADGLLPLSALHGKACIATHVQRDELGRTKNPDRLNALNLVFETVLPKVVPTETSVWNDSNWGQGWAKRYVVQRYASDVDLSGSKIGEACPSIYPVARYSHCRNSLAQSVHACD